MMTTTTTPPLLRSISIGTVKSVFTFLYFSANNIIVAVTSHQELILEFRSINYNFPCLNTLKYPMYMVYEGCLKSSVIVHELLPNYLIVNISI